MNLPYLLGPQGRPKNLANHHVQTLQQVPVGTVHHHEIDLVCYVFCCYLSAGVWPYKHETLSGERLSIIADVHELSTYDKAGNGNKRRSMPSFRMQSI
jgi:hypothetical protein